MNTPEELLPGLIYAQQKSFTQEELKIFSMILREPCTLNELSKKITKPKTTIINTVRRLRFKGAIESISKDENFNLIYTAII
jgi:predicted transcriptional regulator